jgi:hypothetical protein
MERGSIEMEDEVILHNGSDQPTTYDLGLFDSWSCQPALSAGSRWFSVWLMGRTGCWERMKICVWRVWACGVQRWPTILHRQPLPPAAGSLT